MKFLDRQGVQDKIDKFLEEHPTAVIVQKQKEAEPGSEGTKYKNNYLCRFLDKDSKETNFYLYGCVETEHDNCGCWRKKSDMLVLEEANPKRIEKTVERAIKQDISRLLFTVYCSIWQKCRQGWPPEEKYAEICGDYVKYERPKPSPCF